MLTDTKIKKAVKEAVKETLLSDGSAGRGQGALTLRIRPGVSAMWLAKWKRDNRTERLALGSYPDMSLADARTAYRERVADVLAAKRSPKVVVTVEGKPTFGRLCDGYLAHLLAREASDYANAEWLLGEAREVIGENRLAHEIEAADIAAHLSAIYLTGRRSKADHARAWMHAAFNWAIRSANDYRVQGRRDWGLKVNPVSQVPTDHDASLPREFSLSPAELKAVWEGLSGPGFSFGVGCALKLIICCGQRVQETLRVKGADIDLDRKLWHMPLLTRKGGRKGGQKAKTLRPHVIPLPEHAVEIFRVLKAIHGDGPLFPSKYGASDLLASKSISHAVARWLADEKKNVNKVRGEFQPRDLRRTWKTLTEEADIDPFIRDFIQQHAQGGTARQVYDQNNYLRRMREAMDKWEAWLKANGILGTPILPTDAVATLIRAGTQMAA